MSRLQSGIAKLSAEERAALARRLKEKHASPGAAPVIPRREPEGPLPLSFAQHRLWFLDRLDPGNSAYNVYRAVRIGGPLDVAALERSLSEIVRRHEVLRTTFPAADGVPQQVVGPPWPVRLTPVDLSRLPDSERPTSVDRLARLESRRAFDLAKDRLLRARLLRLGAEEHVLLLTTHHIAVDGWSVAILFSELGRLYAAFSGGAASPLAEPAVQFADFAVWQRRSLQGATLRGLVDYWRGQLRNVPVLELPTDRPRPAAQSLENFRGARHFFTMPRQLYDDVTALARRHGATPFMALLAAFEVLLQAYSAQDDFSVGSPIAGRELPELEGLIGCFSNTLVHRANLSGGPNFGELLGRVRETALGAFAHQAMPFEKLVEELRPARTPNRMTLFQVNFRLLTAPLPPPTLADLELAFLEVDNRMAKFDLALELCARPDGLTGYVEYFTDLFDETTVDGMCRDFEHLLSGLVAEPHAPVQLIGQRFARQGKRPMTSHPADDHAGKPSGPAAMRRRAVEVNAANPEPAAAPAEPSGPPREKKPCPAYTYRQATMKDCDFILRLRRSLLSRYVSQVPGWGPEMQEAYYLDFDPSIQLIIVVDGKDVGVRDLKRHDTYLDYRSLLLLPEFHNSGLGHAVCQDVYREADAKGLPVTGHIFKDNPVWRLYQRHGWVITGDEGFRYAIARFPHGKLPEGAAAKDDLSALDPRNAAAAPAPGRAKGLRDIRRRAVGMEKRAPS